MCLDSIMCPECYARGLKCVARFLVCVGADDVVEQ